MITAKEIGKRCFPDYRGRKFFLRIDGMPKNLDSYWDSGSKDFFCFFNLQNGQIKHVHSNHPAFEARFPAELPQEMPQAVVIVKHTIFCGKDMGITVFAHSEAVQKLLIA